MNQNQKLKINPISFLQLKPNSDNNINSICLEIIQKSLLENNFNNKSEVIEDLIDKLDDHFISYKDNDPMRLINDFFRKQNTNTDDTANYYNIIQYNCSNNNYNLMLTNNQINSSPYLQGLSKDKQSSLFNSLASLLAKYYTNSGAIFGDVFFLNINKEYYDILSQLNEPNIEQKQKEHLTTILNNFRISDIYNSVSMFNILEYCASVYYVKIYENTNKKCVYYSREYLNNFIKNKDINIKLDDNNIINITYNGLDLYLKYSEPLPGSHNSVLNMIKTDYTQNTDDKQETFTDYYFVNISDEDIKKCLIK
jgi:hypothetical protein